MLLFWQKQIHVDFTGKYFEERDPDLWRWQNSCLDWRKLGLDADLNNTTLWRRLTTGSGSDAMMTAIFFPFLLYFCSFSPTNSRSGSHEGASPELRRSSLFLASLTSSDVDVFLQRRSSLSRNRFEKSSRLLPPAPPHAQICGVQIWVDCSFEVPVEFVGVRCPGRSSSDLLFLSPFSFEDFYSGCDWFFCWSYMLFLSKSYWEVCWSYMLLW